MKGLCCVVATLVIAACAPVSAESVLPAQPRDLEEALDLINDVVERASPETQHKVLPRWAEYLDQSEAPAGLRAAAWYNVGVAAMQLGHWSDALTALNRSLDLESDQPFAHANAEFVLQQLIQEADEDGQSEAPAGDSTGSDGRSEQERRDSRETESAEDDNSLEPFRDLMPSQQLATQPQSETQAGQDLRQDYPYSW